MDITQYNSKQLHILTYAAKEFLDQGYTAASTNTIAKEAKVAKGLIFHYFKNKENLYGELLDFAFYHVKEFIDGRMLTLSTYMDAFVLIKELILIKEALIIESPLYAPLLLNAFEINTEISPTLRARILHIKEQFENIFASFLDGLFLQERLKPTYKHDAKIFYKIMILFEAAFKYEKEQLLPENDFSVLEKISLDYYETMIKSGILFKN